MAALFVSDLHLDVARPAATDAFLRLLAGPAREVGTVYILGDLFEAWVGDDDDADWLEPIRAALAQLTASGVDCALMHGNRDFLLGARFLADTGARLLDDYALVKLGNTAALLTHGDLLCTDDTRYMTLRSQLRDPAWQTEFLVKPLSERYRIAHELRMLSQTEMAAKPAEIMDVNTATVDAVMRRFGVHTLIHGHTHRPACHRWILDGREALRVVLADWYATASWVVWRDDGGPRVDCFDA